MKSYRWVWSVASPIPVPCGRNEERRRCAPAASISIVSTQQALALNTLVLGKPCRAGRREIGGSAPPSDGRSSGRFEASLGASSAKEEAARKGIGFAYLLATPTNEDDETPLACPDPVPSPVTPVAVGMA